MSWRCTFGLFQQLQVPRLRFICVQRVGGALTMATTAVRILGLAGREGRMGEGREGVRAGVDPGHVGVCDLGGTGRAPLFLWGQRLGRGEGRHSFLARF